MIIGVETNKQKEPRTQNTEQSTQKCKTARDLVEFAVSLISLMFQ